MSIALAQRPAEAADARLSPLERLQALADPGSLQPLRTGARSRALGDRAVPGDGVLAATARVGGRQVACFAQDGSVAGGSLGEAHADTLVRLHELAGRGRMPVVGFVESAGARMQEGLGALAGYGRLFREQVRLSGDVPQISVVCGPCAGGGSYSPALTDFVIMAGPRASMFLTGPGVVASVTGERVDAATLGGPAVHERNGVCHVAAGSEAEAARAARDLLAHLPQSAGASPPRRAAAPPRRVLSDGCVPADPRKVYDVRDVAAGLVDGGELQEISRRWARNVVCALARIDGRPVGVLANQPRHLGGVLDSDGSQKAARFVRTCNLFGLPLVVLVDTPGFLPGTRQERAGVIRHGAKLLHAFAEAQVPRLTVLLRKAYGGAFIAMNSRDLGADLVFAWPGARIGVMGAEQAVEILHRRELAAVGGRARRSALAEAYAAEQLSPGAASAAGVVDEVIAPSATRDRLVATLAALEGADDRPARGRPAGNPPL